MVFLGGGFLVFQGELGVLEVDATFKAGSIGVVEEGKTVGGLALDVYEETVVGGALAKGVIGGLW